ncbi:hypothetical protein [Ferruginibacter sp.]
MKHPILLTITLLCTLFSATAFSQNANGTKAQLFSNFPSKINCSETELSKVFAAAVNQNINVAFSDNFLIDGTVTSNIVKYNNLQTVVIKSPLFADAIFVLSKITNRDNSITYVGRIINRKYFDGYELKKDNFNNYQLVKIETDKVMQDCSHN